jgi:iron complex outermembrane recepter protein
MRIATVLAVAFLGTTSLAAAQHAQAAIQHYQLNIPRQSLDTALKDLAQQTGLQIGRFSGRIDGSAMVGPVRGDQTPEQALKTLLYKTGLNYKIVSDTTIAVYNPKDPTPSTTGLTGADSSLGVPGEGRGEGSGLQLAQSDSSSVISPQSSALKLTQSTVPTGNEVTRPQESPTKIEEIVVTAQKRSERIQDVPVPVTALSTAALAATEQTRINDFYTQVPGLTVSTDGYESGLSTVAIRGVTTGGFSNPTVGIEIDDVPIGSATTSGGGVFAPDLDPSDLTRIEVLRGPQGTLYGANSMGGLLKYVTVDPSTEGVSGRVQAGTSIVKSGDELGYNFRGAVNVPLGETLAVRVSGFTRQDPGYIDNVQTGQKGINESHVSGGRLAALWKPTEDISLKLSALYQDSKADGYSFVDLERGLGDLQQHFLRGTGTSDYTRQIYTGEFKAKLGGIDLTSLSGYSIQNFNYQQDESVYAVAFGAPAHGVTAAAVDIRGNYTKVTQEIRLSAPVGERFEWRVGGFYTHELNKNAQPVFAADAITGAYVAETVRFTARPTYDEYAAFGDLTYHILPRFDVQVGGRESYNKQSTQETDSGLFYTACPNSVCVNPPFHSKDNSFTYLVTPRFRITPDLMVYARLASGYRPGGPNSTAAVGVPTHFSPDNTKNYEIGVKADVMDHALFLDTSVYYIDWKNPQISSLSTSGIGYYTNGSAAKSEGVEFSIEARPLAGTRIDAWVAYNNAVLTENFPAGTVVFGASGDRLPNGSRFSGNASLNQEFSLTDSVKGFVGGSLSYVGDRKGVFASSFSSGARQSYPGYAKADLLTGLTCDSFTMNVFINNIADKRGELAGGLGAGLDPNAFILIQPRTFGLSLVKTF